MPEIRFKKMHGLGNDFVVLDARCGPIALSPSAVRRIGDRHRGVGFDQLVLVATSESADVRLIFFNADGSEAGACGNGTRCAARLLLDETGRDAIRLETRGGLLEASRGDGGQVVVAMAPPRFDWQDIPVAAACDTLAMPVAIEGLPPPSGVSMGNPHAVFFVPDLDAVDVARLGAELEHHAFFPERANIGFAQLLAPDRLRLRVFERGSGLTLACGSGACAALVTAVRRGLVRERAEIVVDVGSLEVAWDGQGPVLMTGPTALSFEGVLAPELLSG